MLLTTTTTTTKRAGRGGERRRRDGRAFERRKKKGGVVGGKEGKDWIREGWSRWILWRREEKAPTPRWVGGTTCNGAPSKSVARVAGEWEHVNRWVLWLWWG